MKIRLFIVSSMLSIQVCGFSQVGYKSFRANDTTVVGKLIASDSVFDFINIDRSGVRYYYGVFHLKIGLVNIDDSTEGDTLILAYVYNMKSDRGQYFRKFDFRDGRSYIFDLGVFHPCKSDFPRLQGRCESGFFYPKSNQLVKRYSSIYRIININQWNGEVKAAPLRKSSLK